MFVLMQKKMRLTLHPTPKRFSILESDKDRYIQTLSFDEWNKYKTPIYQSGAVRQIQKNPELTNRLAITTPQQ
jgi:hypothetical protein